MSAPTRPTYPADWGTSGSAVNTEPPDANRQLGWVYRQKPPYDWMNWLFRKWDAYVAFFNYYAFPTAAVGYPYDVADGAQTYVEYNLSPFCGGWSQVAAVGGTPVTAITLYDATGTPPFIEFDHTIGGGVIIRYSLGPLFGTLAGEVGCAGDPLITAIQILVTGNMTAGTGTLRLMSYKRDGTGGATVVAFQAFANTVGYAPVASISTNISSDHTLQYYLEMQAAPTADADIKICSVKVRLLKQRVE